MCPKGHICCPALLSLTEGTELTIPRVFEWFQVWQSPKKYLGQQLRGGEGAPSLEDVLSGDTEREEEEAVMFSSISVGRLWPS